MGSEMCIRDSSTRSVSGTSGSAACPQLKPPAAIFQAQANKVAPNPPPCPPQPPLASAAVSREVDADPHRPLRPLAVSQKSSGQGVSGPPLAVLQKSASPQERGGSGGAGTPAKKQTQTQTPPRPGGAATPIAPAAIIPPAVKSADSGPIDDPAVSDLSLIHI